MEEDQSTLAVVNDEIQDLTMWLKETESLLCATPRTTDLNAARSVLEKLKVSVECLNLIILNYAYKTLLVMGNTVPNFCMPFSDHNCTYMYLKKAIISVFIFEIYLFAMKKKSCK